MAAEAAAEDRAGEHAALLDLDFARVLQEERELLRRRRERLREPGTAGDAPGRVPFSIAFSGGGIRAAAFEAGVLWRLAQAGRLQDVEYLAAVSGGTYIASAFASHLLAAEPPPTDSGSGKEAGEVPLSPSPKDATDAWYLRVVAETVCRMQRNAGGFVRDPSGGLCSSPKDGSGMLPRILDAPMLIVVLALTLMINPLQLLIVYLIPITEMIQFFFGAALRARFCAPSSAAGWQILVEWSPFGRLLQVFQAAVLANALVWLLSKMPACPLGGVAARAKRLGLDGSLVAHGALGFLSRFVAFLFCVILLLVSAPHIQIWEYGVSSTGSSAYEARREFCHHYVGTGGQDIDGRGRAMGCTDFHQGVPWYTDALFRNYSGTPAGRNPSGTRGYDVTTIIDAQNAALRNPASVLSLFFSVLLVLLLVAFLLVPFFPSLLLTVLLFAGPALSFVAVLILVKYRIYGPLTGQPLMYSWFPFHHERWNALVSCCLLSSLVLVPFYNDLQRLWHWYYLRSLQVNFFAGGRDRPFRELAAHPHCPLMLFTGTVNDYARPGSERVISEISFSALHTGGDATGYLRTPRYRTLAKCMALSGAGCLDAISLSMTGHLRFRFWLEMLNLSWGDYILFSRRESRLVRLCARRAGKKLERSMTWMLLRTPTLIHWLVHVTLLLVGESLGKSSGSRECYFAKGLFVTAAALACGGIMLSFFAFVPGLEFLMFSPLLRQMHQATAFHFHGEQPPGLLYVTDGGVQDCTGIVQLLRRRCARILLVLSAADPQDELLVLRAALEVVAEEKIASFYDPEDPRRDIRILLEEYRADRGMPYLHLAIRYGWGGKCEPEGTGQLFVVKNRLPPALESLPAQPLLTEAEIQGCGGGALDAEAGSALKTTDLGGLGCCDCCHRRGCNCGAKFPHLTGANYLYLTPQLFSSLCRLGHEVSAEVVERIAR